MPRSFHSDDSDEKRKSLARLRASDGKISFSSSNKDEAEARVVGYGERRRGR